MGYKKGLTRTINTYIVNYNLLKNNAMEIKGEAFAKDSPRSSASSFPIPNSKDKPRPN